MLKKLNACVAIVALLAFASCGEDNNTKNNGTTAPNNGTVTNNNGTTSNNGTTAPNNGTTNNNGTTAPPGDQCEAQGDDCDPDKATNAGFVCVRPDANSDAKCETACGDPRDAALDAMAPYTCSSGQLCIDTGGGAFACIRSDCNGLLDTDSCDATQTCIVFNDIVRQDPMDNNSTILRQGSANFCTAPAADAVALGEDCTTLNGCAAGLVCIGTCVLPCGADATCTAEGEACVGEEANFLDQGVGFCDTKCTPYVAASGCGATEICNPITSTEGICIENGAGTVAAYGECSREDNAPAEQSCGANLRCITFQAPSMEEPTLPELSRCLPFCDPTLATPGAQAATCEGIDAHCLDLSAQGADPTPGAGVCVESCGPADYGTNGCTSFESQCSPLNGERHGCFPGIATADKGESCETGDRTKGCKEGLTCTADSTGAGTCTSFCEPNPQAQNLGCEANQSCTAIGSAAYNFGICGQTCTPTNYADTSCPANNQNCVLAKVADTTAVCGPSGSDTGMCASITNNTCINGDSCVNDWMRSLSGDFEAAGACTKQCDLFAADTGCAANEMCAPSLATLSEKVGYCLERGADAPVGMACEENKACGPTSTCLGSAPGQCIPWCLLSDGTGCEAGQNCMPLFGSAQVPFGFCQ